jgi:hypothetical protein
LSTVNLFFIAFPSNEPFLFEIFLMPALPSLCIGGSS